MKMYMKTAQSKSPFVFWNGNPLMVGVGEAIAVTWAGVIICITTSIVSGVSFKRVSVQERMRYSVWMKADFAQINDCPAVVRWSHEMSVNDNDTNRTIRRGNAKVDWIATNVLLGPHQSESARSGVGGGFGANRRNVEDVRDAADQTGDVAPKSGSTNHQRRAASWSAKTYWGGP